MASALEIFDRRSEASRLTLAASRGGPSVGRMFDQAARLHPGRLALDDGVRRLTYRELAQRVERVAATMAHVGVRAGDVIGILSENRIEYVEVELACARLGVMAACLNWRQQADELAHCLSLVESPRLFVSPRYAALAAQLGYRAPQMVEFGQAYEDWIAGDAPAASSIDVDPETGLLVLYTSGTTGYPKGAVISHRAIIARSLIMMAEWSLLSSDGSIAWSPLFHMAASDPMFCALIQGAPVRIVDGFDAPAICNALEQMPVGWFVLLPGMIDRMIDALKTSGVRVNRVAVAGCMANLVPPQQIAEISALLRAPFLNSFGSTETGILPASGSKLPPGAAPASFRKLPNGFCDIRIVDDDDNEIPAGVVGEICVRSPALFSGYWKAPEATVREFRNGWFHMGDDFVRHDDGTLDFVDRRKYLIKSGGENIYPAEIERLLANSERILEAVVVRQPDAKWGEIPVLLIVRRDPSLQEAEVRELIEGRIARYKQPKRILFVPEHWIERNVTGKIRRDLLEQRLLQDPNLSGSA